MRIVLRFDVHPSGSLENPVPSAIAIIPARYQSSRFPGKVLAEIDGRTMIEHVYRRAAAATSIASVIVATDDERIRAAVAAFGGDVRMTSPHHPSGTDRIAEVAAGLDAGLIANVQGDEPLLEPATIDLAVSAFAHDPSLGISTLCRRIDDPADAANPNVTKVVVDRDGHALYFSRSAIPFVRPGCPPAPVWRHIGLYVCRRDVLLRLAALPPTPLEQAEALEQLRALEHGIRIKVLETAHQAIGVDTPEDLERVRRISASLARA